MIRPICQSCLNKNCFIQRSCSEQELTHLNEQKTCIRCTKGQRFIQEELPISGIYFIYSGKIKVTKAGINNREQIVRLAGPGDILGHRGYGIHPVYTIAATSIEDSILCFFRKEDFFTALKEIPALTYNLMIFYAEELDCSENRIKNLMQMNVKERVAYALLMLREAYGEHKGFVNAPLSRQEIGDIAGTTRDQVIRILSGLKRDNIIEAHGKNIRIINRSALIKLLNGYQLYD